MKTLSVVLSLCALLLCASSAQAYTAYNHIDIKVCIIDAGSPENCAIWVPAGGTYHSQRGDVWRDVWIGWDDPANGDCKLSQRIFTIPEKGSVKIYDTEMKTYTSGGKLKATVPMVKRPCSQRLK